MFIVCITDNTEKTLAYDNFIQNTMFTLVYYHSKDKLVRPASPNPTVLLHSTKVNILLLEF